jgi:hypothetical protein
VNAVLYPLAAVVAWAAAAYRLPSAVRRPRDPEVITLTAALCVLGTVFAVSTPAVWTRIDQAAGWPNLSVLLSQGCVMIWTVTVQVMMVLWAYPPDRARAKVRTRLLIAAATIAAMTALFALAPVLPEDSTDFAARFAGRPYITAYLCVYIVAFGWMQGEIVYLCLRTIQVGGRAWLRRGLRLNAAGAILGLVYCLVRTSDVVTATTGIANPVRWEDVARLAVGIGVLLPPIGWTMPSWGPQLTGPRGWAVNAWAYWQLYPLWSVLRGTFADKDLDPAPPRGLAARVAVRDLRWRMTRRLALIWDGTLELRPYRDPALEPARRASAAGGRRGTRQRADAEAESLLAALDAYRQSQQQDGAAQPDRAAGTPPGDSAREQLASELGWLIAVSRAVSRRRGRTPRTARETDPAGSR